MNLDNKISGYNGRADTIVKFAEIGGEMLTALKRKITTSFSKIITEHELTTYLTFSAFRQNFRVELELASRDERIIGFIKTYFVDRSMTLFNVTNENHRYVQLHVAEFDKLGNVNRIQTVEDFAELYIVTVFDNFFKLIEEQHKIHKKAYSLEPIIK